MHRFKSARPLQPVLPAPCIREVTRHRRCALAASRVQSQRVAQHRRPSSTTSLRSTPTTPPEAAAHSSPTITTTPHSVSPATITSSSTSTSTSSTTSSSITPSGASTTVSGTASGFSTLPGRRGFGSVFSRRAVSSSSVPQQAVSSAGALRPSTLAPSILVPSPLATEDDAPPSKKRFLSFVPGTLIDEWKETLNKRFLREDIMAALSVTMVSIPMNLAIALGSGVPPEIGILTGVVAGATAAILGGSKLSITGPTASMSMLVANCVRDHGMAGMALATMFCGAIQMTTGAMKVGGIVKLTPMPVMAGFMTGIGAMIMSSQLPAALGVKSLNLDTLWLNLQQLFQTETMEVLTSQQLTNLISFPSLALAAGTLGLSVALGKTKLASKIPPVMAAVAITSALQAALQMPGVEMIQPLPALAASMSLIPSLPSLDELAHIAGTSLLFYGVCSMESLLSCGVVDKLSKASRTYNPNQELLGQGVSNMVCGAIGGMPATSVIARSSLSVMAGAQTRRAAFSMSMMLLLSTAMLSDVFHHIPIPTLAGVLLSLSYKMMNNAELKQIWKIRKSEALIPGGVTIAGMLSTGVISGVAMGLASSVALNLYHRQKGFKSILHYDILQEGDEAAKGSVHVRLAGQLDFLAGMKVHKLVSDLDERLLTSGGSQSTEMSARRITLDMDVVSVTDTSGALLLAELIAGLQRQGHNVTLQNTASGCRELLTKSGVSDRLIMGR